MIVSIANRNILRPKLRVDVQIYFCQKNFSSYSGQKDQKMLLNGTMKLKREFHRRRTMYVYCLKKMKNQRRDRI